MSVLSTCDDYDIVDDKHLTFLTDVSLVDGFDYWQESRGLFVFKFALSAKQHSLHEQLEQNSSTRFG